MNPYILETAMATRGLLTLIGKDDLVLCDKKSRLQAAVDARQHAQAILYAGAPATGFGEDSTPYFEKQVRDSRVESARLEADIAALELVIVAKEASVQALAAAVLQIAKQGIAIVHRGLVACPAGRPVGRETLSNVIWQGRNQCMHWEENSFGPRVIACFQELAQDFGPELQLPATTPRPLARQILRCLGWNDYDSYERDMVSLLQ